MGRAQNERLEPSSAGKQAQDKACSCSCTQLVPAAASTIPTLSPHAGEVNTLRQGQQTLPSLAEHRPLVEGFLGCAFDRGASLLQRQHQEMRATSVPLACVPALGSSQLGWHKCARSVTVLLPHVWRTLQSRVETRARGKRSERIRRGGLLAAWLLWSFSSVLSQDSQILLQSTHSPMTFPIPKTCPACCLRPKLLCACLGTQLPSTLL